MPRPFPRSNPERTKRPKPARGGRRRARHSIKHARVVRPAPARLPVRRRRRPRSPSTTARRRRPVSSRIVRPVLALSLPAPSPEPAQLLLHVSQHRDPSPPRRARAIPFAFARVPFAFARATDRSTDRARDRAINQSIDERTNERTNQRTNDDRARPSRASLAPTPSTRAPARDRFDSTRSRRRRRRVRRARPRDRGDDARVPANRDDRAPAVPTAATDRFYDSVFIRYRSRCVMYDLVRARRARKKKMGLTRGYEYQ